MRFPRPGFLFLYVCSSHQDIMTGMCAVYLIQIKIYTWWRRGLSHDMGISGSIDYYLIQIKLGHAGDTGVRTCCPMWLPLNLYLIQIKTRERRRGVIAQGLVKAYPLLTNKKNRADLHRQALNPKKPKTLYRFCIYKYRKNN